MHRTCTVEIDGALPVGVRDEVSRRFGHVRVRRDGDRTVVGDLHLDQSGLRGLLDLLWDAGAHVTGVVTAAPGDAGRGRPG